MGLPALIGAAEAIGVVGSRIATFVETTAKSEVREVAVEKAVDYGWGAVEVVDSGADPGSVGLVVVIGLGALVYVICKAG